MISVRTRLAWVSIILLVLSGVGYALDPSGDHRFYTGSLLRVGIVTSLTWLAYPQLADVPRLLVLVIAVGVGLAVVMSPGGLASIARAAVVAGPVLLLLLSVTRRWGAGKGRQS